jgi:hypothetical protein
MMVYGVSYCRMVVGGTQGRRREEHHPTDRRLPVRRTPFGYDVERGTPPLSGTSFGFHHRLTHAHISILTPCHPTARSGRVGKAHASASVAHV